MWFLQFYLISVALCVVVLIIVAKSIKNRIERKYKNFKTQRTSASEVLSAFLPYLVPFINLVLLLVLIFAQNEIEEKIVKTKDLDGSTKEKE